MAWMRDLIKDISKNRWKLIDQVLIVSPISLRIVSNTCVFDYAKVKKWVHSLKM